MSWTQEDQDDLEKLSRVLRDDHGATTYSGIQFDTVRSGMILYGLKAPISEAEQRGERAKLGWELASAHHSDTGDRWHPLCPRYVDSVKSTSTRSARRRDGTRPKFDAGRHLHLWLKAERKRQLKRLSKSEEHQ